MAGSEEPRNRCFVAAVLPHGPAAYDLARWMTRNEAYAGDVIQEAFARVLRYSGTRFQSGIGQTVK